MMKIATLIAVTVLVLIVIPLIGLAYRVRGGWRTDAWNIEGNVVPRLLFSLVLTLFATALLWDWRTLGMLPLVYAGIVFGWFKSADIGRDGDRPALLELLIMSGRGLMLTAPAGAYLGWLGYDWLYVGWGVALGVLYELAHHARRWGNGFNPGMEIGEFYTGVWLGAGVVMLKLVAMGLLAW